MSAQNHKSALDALPAETPPETLSGTSVEALFRQHNKTLVRFLAARLSSDAEAKEVAQEAYVRLLQLDQPHAIGFLRAYLFKTANNIATDHLRRRRLTRTLGTNDLFDLGIDDIQPEDHVSSAEDIAIVAASLKELDPRCRRAVLLSRVEGRSTAEIAGIVGVSDRMVRKYIVQALLLIRERLDAAHRSSRHNDASSTHRDE